MKIIIKYDSIADESFITEKVVDIISKSVFRENIEFFITVRGDTRESKFNDLTEICLKNNVTLRVAEVNSDTCHAWEYLEMYIRAIMQPGEKNSVIIFINDSVDIIFDAFDIVISNHINKNECLWYFDGQSKECRVPIMGSLFLENNRDKCFNNSFTEYIKSTKNYKYYDHQLFSVSTM